METIYVLNAFCCLLLHVLPTDAQYAWTGPYRMVAKCAAMKRELILDSKLQVQSMTFVRRSYSKNYQYNLGEQYFHVKTRYNKMMSLYEDLEKESSYEYQIWRTKLLVQIMRLAMEINQMTLMIEEGEEMQMTRKEKYDHFMKKSEMRMGDIAGTQQAANKTILRAHMRSRGLARRSGDPTGRIRRMGPPAGPRRLGAKRNGLREAARFTRPKQSG